MSPERSASEIESVIRAEFAKTPKPTNLRLTSTLDDEGAQEYFQGRTWDGHNAKEIRMQASALCFFTPEAFRYYLPAFMLAELSDPETADIVGEYVIYHFGPQNEASQSWQAERLAIMSTGEKLAVLQFIRYMQERYGGFEAYLDYFEGVVSGYRD